MAKRKKKFNPLAQPTESRQFMNSKGYVVTVVRGEDSADGSYHLPRYMTGRDWRLWMDEMRSEVETFLNFKEFGDVNHPEYVAPVEVPAEDDK